MRFEELLGRQERGELTQAEAGEMLGVSERTVRRWQVRYWEEGAPGLRDRRIGKPSPRRADEGELTRATVYAPAEIAAGTCPFVEAPVEVVAVKSVLVTFDFDPARNAYHGASCRLVADISHLLVTRFERPRLSGHPKWRSVDFTAIPPGWTVGDCVLQGLDPVYAFTCRRPDGSAVAEEAVAGTRTGCSGAGSARGSGASRVSRPLSRGSSWAGTAHAAIVAQLSSAQ